MKKFLCVLVLVLITFMGGCSLFSHHSNPDPKPNPTATPKPLDTGLTVVNGKLNYRGSPIMLTGYGDYGMIGNRRLFPTIDSINTYLSTISGYGVNLTRNFVAMAGPFGPYNFVSGTDFVLTKERALEVKNWHKYQHTESWIDQWNPEFWNRLRAVCQKSKDTNMIVCLTIWDHWYMYRGQNYKLGYAEGGQWVGEGDARSLTFWDWCPYNPGNCWTAEQPVPLSEFSQDYRDWPPSNGDNLIFHQGAFYKDSPDRRRIFGELIDKLMLETKGFDNIIYEIGNELRDYTSEDQLKSFQEWAANRIKAVKPSAIITSSTDLNSAFHVPYINFAMVHGLGNANCNANNINCVDHFAGRPLLIDDDGCWASAQPGGQRDKPEFILSVLQHAKACGFHTNTKQSMVPLNYDILNTIKSFKTGSTQTKTKSMDSGAIKPQFYMPVEAECE
jgi:hypothetical protein